MTQKGKARSLTGEVWVRPHNRLPERLPQAPRDWVPKNDDIASQVRRARFYGNVLSVLESRSEKRLWMTSFGAPNLPLATGNCTAHAGTQCCHSSNLCCYA